MAFIKFSWTGYCDEVYSLIVTKINEYISQWNLQLII
jgi:hypothetical protein